MSSVETWPGRIKKMFGQRFVAGTWSAFAAVIVIMIAIMSNMVVSSLPVTSTQVDMTSNSLYSLSDQTRQIVATLNKDVTLYQIASSGSEDATIARFLSQYSALSNHIKVVNIDPDEKPTFLKGYTLETDRLYQNSVLVDSGNRYRLVGYNEIYVTNYSMDYNTYSYNTSTSFAGEKALTQAIHYVTNDNLAKVYMLTGHGESLPHEMMGLIKRDNMEYDSVSLLSKEAVPDDAATVIINSPTSDLSDDETSKLITYVKNGGNLVLISDYIPEGKMTNLLKLTNAMGLTVQPGIIIEGDQNKYISRYPHYILPEMTSHDITNALKKNGFYVLAPIAQPIAEVNDTESTGAKVTWLLTTSTSSYAKQAALYMKTTEKEEGDTNGPFHVGAVSENGGKLIWFSSAGILNNDVDRTVAGGNSNLVLNALNWMGGQEESISIRPKPANEERLTVPASSSAFWSLIMIGIIPGMLITIGIIIYIRRKRR